MGFLTRLTLPISATLILLTAAIARPQENDEILPPPGWASKRPANKTELLVKDFYDLKHAKLSAKEREDKIWEILANLEAGLPGMKDPFALSEDATLLMSDGVMRDVNLLEYCGPDPVVQAHLRWRAFAVRLLLMKTHKDAAALAAGIAAKINKQNMDTWDRLDQLAHTAEYSVHLETYDLAISLPINLRKAMTDASLTALNQWDNKESTVMPRVHLMRGKLNWAEGNFDAAIKMFEDVAAKMPEIDPAPTAEEIFDAKYSIAVAELEAGRLDLSQAALDALGPWCKAQMPANAETQKGIAVANALLQYRIDLVRSAHAAAPEHKAWRDKADKVLDDLARTRPDFQSTIQRLRVANFPADVPIDRVPPPMLHWMIARAYELADLINDQQPSDSPVLQRGLDAAHEILTRPNAVGITLDMKEAATRVTGMLLELLGRRREAVHAFIKYATDYPTHLPADVQWCLDHAASIVTTLHKAQPNDKEVVALGDQVITAYQTVAAKSPDPNAKLLATVSADTLAKSLR